jgi:hypothetical protein
MITPWHIEQFLFYEYIIMNRIIARYYVLQFQEACTTCYTLSIVLLSIHNEQTPIQITHHTKNYEELIHITKLERFLNIALRQPVF